MSYLDNELNDDGPRYIDLSDDDLNGGINQNLLPSKEDYWDGFMEENNSESNDSENKEDEKSYLNKKRKQSLESEKNNFESEMAKKDLNKSKYNKYNFIDNEHDNKEGDAKYSSKQINLEKKLSSTGYQTKKIKMKENIEKESKNGNEENNNEDNIEITQEKEEEKKENLGKNEYFYPKLWVFFMLYIRKECKKNSEKDEFKLYPPIRELTTLNLHYLYVYLNILTIRNFLIITPEIKNEFDKLLFELEIIENKEKKEA